MKTDPYEPTRAMLARVVNMQRFPCQYEGRRNSSRRMRNMAKFTTVHNGDTRKERRAALARERQLPGRLARALDEAKAAAEAHDPEHYKTSTARALIEKHKAFEGLRKHARKLGVR